MRHIAFTGPALALILGLAVAANPAAGQQMTSQGTIYGQGWNMGQDFDSLNAMSRVNSPLARDRAARVARQAQFNRNYPGTPIRPVSTQAR
jgi:hypothetical protein